MRLHTIKTLGRGGFGVVEEVGDSEGNRFARKTFAPRSIEVQFHDKLRKRFRREVITQQELGGSEILPIIEHNLNGDEPWFLMPLAEATYQKKIEEDRKAGSIEIDAIADILNGLQRLHDFGYVHRDLNPNNILLHDGTWKLSDLGAVLPPSGGTMTLTEDTVIYTERYCAPEQRQNFHNAQAPADIYSFGCILHDIFGSQTRTPYAKHSAPGAIGIVIEKCTDSNPARRPSLNVLRSLVLDTLFQEGGHCRVEDAKAGEWLEKLGQIEHWDAQTIENFARFFAELDISERAVGHEKDWVYSLSTPFLTRLPNSALQKIVERKDGISAAIIEKYCEWAGGTHFEFNFADSICSRLNVIFDLGTPADKACAFAALVKLGESHNRWYVMRCMVNRCKSNSMTPDLAKRVVIELKTEELEWKFKRCVLEVKIDNQLLSPEIVKLLS